MRWIPAAGVAAALMLIAKVGSAQDPEAEALEQREAGEAHSRGEAGGDPQGFSKCGSKLLEAYETSSEAHADPGMLWRAADCSQLAKELELTIQAWTSLVDRHPESELARDALQYLAEAYATVAYYQQSAERHEQFAERYPNDQRTPAALHNAYLFRIGLGQRDAAIADLSNYESLYRRKDPKTAAAIFWSRHDLLDAWKDQRQHALDYLARYRKTGGLDRYVVAEAVIAQIDWRRSCSEPLLYDTCVTVEREREHPSVTALARLMPAPAPATTTKPKRCGSPTQAITTVHRRDAKLSAAAQLRFKKILKNIDAGERIEFWPHDRRRQADFNDAWAMAIVYQADAMYEEYLGLELPANLDFAMDDQSGDSLRRLREFLADKDTLEHRLVARYREVEATTSPRWIIVAAARVALISQTLADQLHRAKVPRRLRDKAKVQRFCAIQADMAGSIQAKALTAWRYCLERSTELDYWSETSRLCEAELAQQAGGRYPATVELFGEPGYAGGEITAVGVLSEDEGKRLVD